jgi:hypothetical protein
VRVLKIATASALALALAASAAFAGGSCCAKNASAGMCTASQTASCQASAMEGCRVEATRLSSGDLVVHYIGTTPQAIAMLHAKAAGSAEKFCCGMTQKMASNTNCKVDMSKVSNGVIVFVTSPKKEVVDQYEKEFAALTAAK